jgi:hypothetical protein
MMYSNDVIVLFKMLKDYNEEIEKIIVSSSDDDNKEFSNEDLSVLIENIIIDLKYLDRNLK